MKKKSSVDNTKGVGCLHEVIRLGGPFYPAALPPGPLWLLNSSHHVLIPVRMKEEARVVPIQNGK